MSREVALACRAVVKRYGQVLAVDGLDLAVARGECVLLHQIGGVPASTYIRRDPSTVHRDHFHAEFNVP